MLSDPPSPEPSRWVLEMFASDVLAWNRAFNELEKKPLTASEEILVHSFDRYLGSKGYLTEKQVEVLRGIARRHDVSLPPIPPTSHHSQGGERTQEATALLPEKGQVEYPLPTLPVELLPEPLRTAEIGWLAGFIDSEGHIDEARIGKDEIGKTDRKTYRWEWMRPRIRVSSTTREMRDKFDRLVKAHARWTEERPQPVLPYHSAEVYVAKAIKLLILCEPYLVKWKQKARQLIQKYRERPEIRTR